MAAVLPAGGYDLRVRMETERTGSAVDGLFPEATYPNGRTICKGAWENQDSTYIFKELPEKPIQIRYVIGGSQWAEDIPAPVDTITIRLPEGMRTQALAEVTVEADRQ